MLAAADESGWFVSFVVDENANNPTTNKKIQEGDIIEAGIAGNETVRVAVKRAGNGELRVQTKSNNIGFYHQARAVKEQSHMLDGRVDDQIPDPENLVAKYKLGLSLDLAGGRVEKKYDRLLGANLKQTMTIRTLFDDPAHEGSFRIASSLSSHYGSSQVWTFAGEGSYRQEPFKTTAWNQKLHDEVTLDLTLYCGEAANKEMKIIRPTGYYFYNDYSSMQVRDGKWKTRSIKAGSTIDVGINVCGKITPVLYKISSNAVADTLRDLDVCKCY